MKVATGIYNNKEIIGVIKNGLFYPFKDNLIDADSVNELISKYSLEDLLNVKYNKSINLNQVKLLAAIPNPKQDILALGLNYVEHAKESMSFKQEIFSLGTAPVYFSKRTSNIITDGDYIDGHFDIVDSLDYEVELAFIISKDCYQVTKEEAINYVFGYTVFNDVSARNQQSLHKQWYYGKSLDTFSVMGNYIVTKDEFDGFPKVNIKSIINDEVRQNSNTERLIYDIPYIINDLSKGMTLKSGTIIITGTPENSGMGYKPPRFLKKGDKVTCSIDKIGSITNIIK